MLIVKLQVRFNRLILRSSPLPETGGELHKTLQYKESRIICPLS